MQVVEVEPEEDLSDEACSEDSFTVEAIVEISLDDDNYIHYLCRDGEGHEEYIDRSDLMDGGRTQALVRRFERANPPPWDPVCTYCDGDGCEECECSECDRKCRHINGVNYGCPHHPVI